MKQIIRRYIDKILRLCQLSREDADEWELARLEQIENALFSLLSSISKRKNKE